MGSVNRDDRAIVISELSVFRKHSNKGLRSIARCQCTRQIHKTGNSFPSKIVRPRLAQTWERLVKIDCCLAMRIKFLAWICLIAIANKNSRQAQSISARMYAICGRIDFRNLERLLWCNPVLDTVLKAEGTSRFNAAYNCTLSSRRWRN